MAPNDIDTLIAQVYSRAYAATASRGPGYDPGNTARRAVCDFIMMMRGIDPGNWGSVKLPDTTSEVK